MKVERERGARESDEEKRNDSHFGEKTTDLSPPLFLFLLASSPKASFALNMADDYGYPSYGRGGGGKSYEPFR